MNDPYRTLGVPSTADAKDIKKAFRKLTQQYHPDKNPGDAAAESRFKDVSQAYEILGDSDRRAHWDEFGEISLSQGFDPARARAYTRARGGFGARRPGGGFGGGSPFSDLSGAREASFDDLLSKLFGGGTVSGGGDLFGNMNERRKGRDLEGAISVSLPDSIAGVTVPVRVTNADGTARTLDVKVPMGMPDQGKLRLRGQGGPGSPAGDLLLTVQVKRHPQVSREGTQLKVTLPVTAYEAYAGGSVEVPTPWGAVTLKLPERSQNRQTFRLRGKGVHQRGKPDGDLLITLDVRLPTQDDEALKEHLLRLQGDDNPRTDDPW